MSKHIKKLKAIVGYDDISNKKKLLREATFDNKQLLIGLGSSILGIYFFLLPVYAIWVSIICKCIGVFLFLSGIGNILGCFHFEDKMHNKLESKTDNEFFKR